MADYVLPGTSKSIWGFDPRSIGGCAIWYDAADSSSVTVTGSNVTAWRDKSGNGRNASPTTGAFQYVSAFNGSYPTLSSSISGGNGQIASIPSFTLSNPSTLFAVIQNRGLNSGTNTFPYLFNVGSGGNRAYAYAYNQTTTPGSFRISTGSPGTGNIDVATAVDTTTAQVFTMQMGVPSTLSYTNGNLISTTTNSGAPVNSSTLSIGGSGGGTNERWTGHFCEFIIINNPISTTQRQQIEGYLAWKWGLQARLPTNHPYSPNLIAPSTYGGLALWLDAADASTVTLSGSNVTQWNDKSGNRHNFTANGAEFPTYSSNVKNGLSAVTFNGTNQNMNNSTIGFPNSAYTIFTVQYLARASVASGGYQQLLTGGSSTALSVSTLNGNVSVYTGNAAGTWNDTNALANPAVSNLLVWRIVSLTVSSTVLTTFVDGSPNTVKTGTTGAFTGMNIGTALPFGAIQLWDGYAGEIVIYNSALTTTQRQQIEGYLAWKWGIQARLPTNHPYSPYLFAPPNYGGLALWLDAADASTVVSSGSSVSQWNDKSGNGANATQATPENRPTYVNNVVNNLSAVRFNATSGHHFRIPGNQLDIAAEDFAIFSVVQYTPRGSPIPIIGKGVGESATRQWRLSFDTGGIFQIAMFVDGNQISSGSAYTISGWGLFSGVVYRGTSIQGFINASGLSTGVSLSGTLTDTSAFVQIGRGWGGSNIFNSDMGEILVYKGTITATQRQQIEAYLAWKWGLQASLPVTHPYYTIAPYYTPNPYSALGPPLSRQFSPTDIATPCRLWCDSSDSVYQGPVGTSSVFASGLGSGPRCGRFDSAGNLWVVLGGSTTTLNRITSAGVVSTVTVTGTSLPGSVPGYLAIDGANNLYVGSTNFINTPIVRVTPAGVGSVYVTPPGQVVRGLAWDSPNSLLWWGRPDGNLVKFDGTTQTVYSGGFGSGQVLVGAVYGGFVYTHNTDINRIVRYNTSGTPVGTIVSTSGNALLKDLTDLNVDSNGIVYAANVAIGPSLIVRIGTDGSVANYSFADFQFGVALDSSNRLYTIGLSASNVLRYTDGGIGVGRWTDKSGNGNDIGIFAGTRPTYDSATKLVSFSNASYFQTPTLTMASGTARCTFLVYRVPTLPSDSTQIFLNPMITGTTQSNAAGGYFIRFNRNVSSTYYIEQGAGQGPYIFFGPSTQTGYNGAYMVHCVQRNGNDFVSSLNGNAQFGPSHALTSNIATISGARMSGTTATLTITNGTNYAGQPITVSGVTVASGFNYNGSWTVLASPAPTTTSVSYTIATNIPNVSGGGGTVSGFYNSNPLSDVYRIGQPPTVVGPMSFGEVIMYDGALSDVDRLRVESYLMWKWNNVRTSYPTAAGSIVPNFPPTHPFYTFPAPTVTFNPRSFGNLYMWYDGADASTIRVSTGTNVTEWRDKSGNGNNLSGTATRTRTSANAVGFDITFNGTSNSMSTTSLAVPINSTSFTYFTVVINNEPSSGYGRIVSAGTTTDIGADNSGFMISNDGSTTSAPFRMGLQKGSVAISSQLTKGAYHIVSVVFSTTPTATLFFNGSQVGTFTPASATFNFTRFSLGNSVGGGNQLNGVINESIAFTTALTASQRQQVEGYLAWKWGLQNLLPVTHSYIKVRP